MTTDTVSSTLDPPPWSPSSTGHAWAESLTGCAVCRSLLVALAFLVEQRVEIPREARVRLAFCCLVPVDRNSELCARHHHLAGFEASA